MDDSADIYFIQHFADITSVNLFVFQYVGGIKSVVPTAKFHSTFIVVLGTITPNNAGKTMAHEHLCCNSKPLEVKDTGPFKKYSNADISLDMLWWLNQHP